MDSNTRDRLNHINRAFYAAVAEDFSATREHPWPGWRRVLEDAKRGCEPGATGEPLRVLDIGCGNGRFASFLAAECERPFRYFGIDSSRALLAIASHRCRDAPHIEFAFGDVLDCLAPTAGSVELKAESPPGMSYTPSAAQTRDPGEAHELEAIGRALTPAGFDLVLLFGLLHHVPGFETRRLLLHRLARCLAPGARLALAAWRFGAFERFRSRILSWREYNRKAAEPIDPAQLEPRDHLLGWGGQDAAPRYCHFVDEAEMEALLAGLELEPSDEFVADGSSGDLNHYVVLRRSDARR